MATNNSNATSKSWREFPYEIQIRYGSAIAESIGMQVYVALCEREDLPYIVWEGTEEQFRLTGFITPGFKFDLKESRWFCPSGFRGYLYRIDADSYRYEIEFVNYSKIQEGKFSRRAEADEKYQAFRAAMLSPVELSNE